jgi:hypothetical protein
VVYREVVLIALVDYLRTRVTASREDTTGYLQLTFEANLDVVSYAWACLVLTNFVDFNKPVDMWALNDLGRKTPNEDIARTVTALTQKYLTQGTLIHASHEAWEKFPRSWKRYPSSPNSKGKIYSTMWWLRSDYQGRVHFNDTPTICIRRDHSSWVWVVFRSPKEMHDAHTAVAHGLAKSEEEAIHGALSKVPGTVASEGLRTSAKEYFRRLHVEKRMTETPRVESYSPSNREVIYTDKYVKDLGFIDQEHLILRRTASYVFVSREPASEIEARLSDMSKPLGYRCDVPCIRLDRHYLEENGFDTSDVTLKTYYLKRTVERRTAHACLQALGLTYPCTERDVRKAYRNLVKKAHPDHGGTTKTFQDLKRNYEEALRLFRASHPQAPSTQQPNAPTSSV